MYRKNKQENKNQHNKIVQHQVNILPSIKRTQHNEKYKTKHKNNKTVSPQSEQEKCNENKGTISSHKDVKNGITTQKKCKSHT